MLAEKQMQLSLRLFGAGLPDLKKVVVIPYARSKQDTDLSKIPNRCVMITQNTREPAGTDADGEASFVR